MSFLGERYRDVAYFLFSLIHKYLDQPPQLNSPFPPPYEDEITLKELLLKVRDFGKEIWAKKLGILVVAIITAGGFFWNAYAEETTYNTYLSFLVRGKKQNNRQFNSHGPLNNNMMIDRELTKLIELGGSNKIINSVLFHKVDLNERNDFMANHLIDLYEYHPKWDAEKATSQFKEVPLKKFYFRHDTIRQFTPKEYRALGILHELVVGNPFIERPGLTDISYDNITGIVKLSVKAKAASIALKLKEAIFQELQEFTIDETIGRKRQAFALLKHKSDSVFIDLNKQERQLALEIDRNRNTIYQSAQLNKDRLRRSVNRTNALYEQLLKNKEQMELSMTTDTPEFIIVNQTFTAIENTPSYKTALLSGGILGGLLGMALVLIRKIFRDALAPSI